MQKLIIFLSSKGKKTKRSEKTKLVNKVRDLYTKKYSMTKIAEILALDRRTVKKYIDPNFTQTVTRRSTKIKYIGPIQR
ncbi:hypothetical protein SH2C18_21690 [Clostridium sediminicola]